MAEDHDTYLLEQVFELLALEPERVFRTLVDFLVAERTNEHWAVWRGDRANGPDAPLARCQHELNGILLMISDALASHVHIFTEAELCEVCGFDRSA